MPDSSTDVGVLVQDLTGPDGKPLPTDHRGIDIVKNVVLIGDKHEGRFRGPTGEFYDFFVLSDTQEVLVAAESQQKIVDSKLKGGDYRPDRHQLVARFATVPENAYIAGHYELRERDKAGGVAKVLKASSDLAGFLGGAVATSFGGPGAAKPGSAVAKGAVGITAAALELDGDDEVIVDQFGLDRFQDWEIGAYQKLRSHHSDNSRCIMSVRAAGDARVSQHGTVDVSVRNWYRGQRTAQFDLVNVDDTQEGWLSVLWIPQKSLMTKAQMQRTGGTITIESANGEDTVFRPSVWQPSFFNLRRVRGNCRALITSDPSMVGELAFIWTHSSQRPV